MLAASPEIYRHYKGGVYLKLGEALHTETDEVMVIYASTENGAVYCRPKAMFEETIDTGAYQGPRFTLQEG